MFRRVKSQVLKCIFHSYCEYAPHQGHRCTEYAMTFLGWQAELGSPGAPVDCRAYMFTYLRSGLTL